MSEKRLTWQSHHPDIYAAYNDKEEQVGSLFYERVGAHMHWCWYQEADMRMSPGCLQEVRDKQKELLKTRSR
jgi:hypothetical protein